MHSNRRTIMGLGAAAAAALILTSMHVPARANALDPPQACELITFERCTLNSMGEIVHVETVGHVAFVDGVYVAPGTEQLRLFYGDLYRPMGDRVAAMQPDNGAGQVSGDRAQSVGKAGDLKADRPGEIKSQVPGAQKVDATKPQSWLRRLMYPLRPVPS